MRVGIAECAYFSVPGIDEVSSRCDTTVVKQGVSTLEAMPSIIPQSFCSGAGTSLSEFLNVVALSFNQRLMESKFSRGLQMERRRSSGAFLRTESVKVQLR
jgi:hypothetical protein